MALRTHRAAGAPMSRSKTATATSWLVSSTGANPRPLARVEARSWFLARADAMASLHLGPGELEVTRDDAPKPESNATQQRRRIQ
jgi:hypothetical protein